MNENASEGMIAGQKCWRDNGATRTLPLFRRLKCGSVIRA